MAKPKGGIRRSVQDDTATKAIETDGGDIAQGVAHKTETAVTDTETVQGLATDGETVTESATGADTVLVAANTDDVMTAPSLEKNASQTRDDQDLDRVRRIVVAGVIPGAGHHTRLRRGRTEQCIKYTHSLPPSRFSIRTDCNVNAHQPKVTLLR